MCLKNVFDSENIIKQFINSTFHTSFILILTKRLFYQVGVSSGKVATLSGSEVSSVLDLSEDEVVADLLSEDGDEAVVDENALAWRHDLKQSKTIVNNSKSFDWIWSNGEPAGFSIRVHLKFLLNKVSDGFDFGIEGSFTLSVTELLSNRQHLGTFRKHK